MNKQNRASKEYRNFVRAFGQFRSGLLWYATLKMLLLLILGVLYSQVLGQIGKGGTPIYDLGILRVIDLRTITIVIAAGAMIVLSFIFERSFLVFYFSQSYQGKQVHRANIIRKFVGTTYRQVQLYCLEFISYAGLLFLFVFISLVAYSILGYGVAFLIILLIQALVVIVLSARIFLTFVFAFFHLFQTEEKKPTVFSYLASEIPAGSTQNSLWIWGRFIILTFILGSLLTVASFVSQWIIGALPGGNPQILLLIGSLFLAAAGGIIVSGVMAVLFFGDMAELYFKHSLPTGNSSQQDVGAQNLKLGWLLAALMIAVVGFSIVGFSAAKPILKRANQPHVVFAHRGYSSVHVQNSLGAFRAAVGAADFIELDVQISRDGQLIIFHDENFEDLTGEVGVVAQRPYSEIANYITTETKTIESRTEILTARIPLLKEVFQETGDDIQYAIEVKNTAPERMPELVSKLISLMQEFEQDKKSYVISLDYGVLKEVKRLAPDIRTGIILTLSTAPPDAFDVDIYFLNALTSSYDNVKAIHQLGREAYFWSFGSFTRGFKSEFFIGADGFIADDPLETRRLLDEYRNMSTPEKIKEIFAAIFQ